MKFDPVVHPLVITQLETGRKVLKFPPCTPDIFWGWIAPKAMLCYPNWGMNHGAEGVPLDCFRLARRSIAIAMFRGS
jgi:taurine dioxygenase